MTNIKTSEGFNMPANSFEHLVNLTELDLSNNNMTTLDSKLFSYLPKLETIDLSNNQLNIGPSMLLHLQKLKKVIIDEYQMNKDLQDIYRENFN